MRSLNFTSVSTPLESRRLYSQHLARNLASSRCQWVFVEQMSRQRSRKHAYLTDEESEAREIEGLAQSHTAHLGGVGLQLVQWAPAPKFLAPSPTPLPPLGAIEAGEPLCIPEGGD